MPLAGPIHHSAIRYDIGWVECWCGVKGHLTGVTPTEIATHQRVEFEKLRVEVGPPQSLVSIRHSMQLDENITARPVFQIFSQVIN